MIWSPDDESVDEGECKSDGISGLSFDDTVTFDECTPFTRLGVIERDVSMCYCLPRVSLYDGKSSSVRVRAAAVSSSSLSSSTQSIPAVKFKE
jgi:hypothetical protein